MDTALHTVDPELYFTDERFRSLFDVLPVAVHEIDAFGLVVRVNEAECNLLGYQADEMVGRPVWHFVAPEQQEISHRSLLRKISGKQPLVPFERQYMHRDGRMLTFQVHDAHIRNGAGIIIGIRSVLLDVTERHEYAARLAEKAEELERSNAELEQFAYVASHDLQEPLRMVASYTQLLARRYKDRLDRDAMEYIDFAVDGAKRMQQLIQDLLAFSRVGRRGRDFEPADADLALRQALTNLEVQIAERQAVITHDLLPTVVADDVQLAQVFQNLIGNGLKYCETAPRIHVGARDENSSWHFWVQDNGIGIDSQYSERVFQVFQRLHTREEYPGTGIGLAICKKVVERHGGRIWFGCNPEGGATFHFTILKQAR